MTQDLVELCTTLYSCGFNYWHPHIKYLVKAPPPREGNDSAPLRVKYDRITFQSTDWVFPHANG